MRHAGKLAALCSLGGALLVFGTGLCIAAVALASWVPGFCDEQIKQAASITNSGSLKSFLRNDQRSATPKYFVYNHFNVTNVEEYLSGGKAVLKEVGPFYLREYSVFLDARMDEDRVGTVTYREWDHYVLDAQQLPVPVGSRPKAVGRTVPQNACRQRDSLFPRASREAVPRLMADPAADL